MRTMVMRAKDGDAATRNLVEDRASKAAGSVGRAAKRNVRTLGDELRGRSGGGAIKMIITHRPGRRPSLKRAAGRY